MDETLLMEENNMEESLFRKSLVVGIILLFIGVGVQPALANKSITYITEIKQNCDCQVTDNFYLIRLESLLTRAERLISRVEILTNLILLLSKDYPEVIEDREELSEMFITLRDMNGELDLNHSHREYPIICELLDSLLKIIGIPTVIFYELYEKYYDYPILREFFNMFLLFFAGTFGTIIMIMMLLDCPLL